ncbi:unnamed protein product [Rhizoctonia solani]|uniref:DUF6534 domain-containing protein n=1 Tax=Rhizoctonia solani TaxID=456999 RepID=A0A8H2ZZN3_9AGAM|nr:uncharacterized protein RhiXN_01180 [Rhizoctonia solani]KAF8680460.1 hypothetical protein RHS04_03892 [Rhizoctonia solani]QRW19774.1 hypothetical protein RhiXN_01180 [Rhizoctonia solani]CAE6341804.1 unnamed protein product [Rhizoctonia solani]
MSTYPGFLNSNYKPISIELPYINNTAGMLGPWLLASIFCLMMEGILLCQTFNYAVGYPHDRLMLRLLVGVSVLFCSFKAGHMIYISWDFFIAHFGNYLSASIPTASVKLTGLESSIIGAMIQAFFIHRTFVLSRNWIFLVLTIPTLLLGLAGALILTILVFDLKLLTKNGVLLNASANMMVSCVVICDVFITVFTCWYLLRAKTGFTATNNLITRLLYTAIQSALPPTICAILNLYWNSRAASTTWVNFFNSLMPFFYVCSMVFTLNSRASVSRSGTSYSTGGNAYEMRTGNRNPTGPASRDQETTRPEVYISRQTHVDAISSRNGVQTFDAKESNVYTSDQGSVHKVVALTGDDGDDDGSSSYRKGSAV